MFSCKAVCKYSLKKTTTKKVTVVKSLKARSLITRDILLQAASHSSFISWVYWWQAHTSTKQSTEMQKQTQIFSLEHWIRKGGWKYFSKICRDKLFSYKKKMNSTAVTPPAHSCGTLAARILPAGDSQPRLHVRAPWETFTKYSCPDPGPRDSDLIDLEWMILTCCQSPDPRAVLKANKSRPSIT